MKLFGLFLLLSPLLGSADTLYYVDYGRSANGTGTAANPWNSFHTGVIDWTTISNNLLTGNVKIFFSSRMLSNDGTDWLLPVCGPNWLSIVGDEQYNTNATGTAVWFTENTGSRAKQRGAGMLIPNSTSGTGFSNCVVKGLIVESNGYTAFNFSAQDCCGTSPPFVGCCSTNIHSIHVTNCMAQWITGPGGYFVFWGNNTTNCYDYVISGSQASNLTQAATYTCRYSYLDNGVTNCVIENNIFWNCCRTNLSGGPAGDSAVINVKPGTYGCIVQNNLVGRDPGIGGGGNGLFALADHMIIRGNTFIHMDFYQGGSYGNGIFASSGGDAQGDGKNITACDIYNNVVVSCASKGINLDDTTGGVSLTGAHVFNNTVVSNGVGGLSGKNVSAITNNIFQNNGGAGNEMSIITASADNNLYFRSDGSALNSVNAAQKTWAQWQALGFDPHGLNVDPTLNPNYSIPSTSPAKDSGTTITSFSTDILGTTRPQGPAWDMGAFEFIQGVLIGAGVTLGSGVTVY